MTFQRTTFEHAANLVRAANGGDLLIAAYGSLPLKPEPELVPAGAALIPQYRKALCIRVTTCRGTSLNEGRVAGLIPDPNESALTMIMRAHGGPDTELMERLARRELDGLAYEARPLLCNLVNGGNVIALGFVAETEHPGFREDFEEELVDIVASAKGTCGSNLEYLDMILAFERATFGRTTAHLAHLRDRITASHGDRLSTNDQMRLRAHPKFAVLRNRMTLFGPPCP